MRRPSLRALLAPTLAAAALAACRAPAPAAAPAPERVVVAPRALAVYRAVAESIYVRSTRRPVAVLPWTVDTVCSRPACPPLAARWGVDSAWWSAVDSVEVRAARADLLARAGMRQEVGAVPLGRPNLVTLDTTVAPFGGDASRWVTFRDTHGGAAGVVSFSPVGFAPSGRAALVFVSWRCGPTCGHDLAAALTASNDGGWRVADVLLLQPEGTR